MITLDIVDTSIRMMVVSGKRVKIAVILPLEPGMVKDGVVMDKAAVSQQIIELMKANGVEEKQAVVSISGIHTMYRVLSLPRLSKDMLDEAVRRESERVMAVPLNELYISWQAIEVSNVETAICLVGLPRNTVDAVMETLRQAGLQSKLMDTRPLALARVADEKDALIINVQPVGFDIVVMMDGIPQLLRSLPFPAADISAADKVAAMKEELDRPVAFYNSSHKERPITSNVAAFVSGELCETLAKALNYRVKPLPQLLAYPEGFDANEYAANIGLALKQVQVGDSRVRANINVVPEIYLPKPRPVTAYISWALVIVAIAVLVPLAIATQREVRESLALQARVNAAEAQVQARTGTEASLKELQANLDKAKAALDAIQQPLNEAKAQREKVNEGLKAVTALLPGTAVPKSISYGESLTIAATAPDKTTILDYVTALRNTGRFSQVIISDMHEVEYNKWDFLLTLK